MLARQSATTICKAAKEKVSRATDSKRASSAKVGAPQRPTGPQRGADGRIEIRVSKDTITGRLAGALYQSLKQEAVNGIPSVCVLCGGSHPVFTTARALALANLMGSKQDGQLLNFVPTITKGLTAASYGEWAYSTDAFFTPIPTEPVEGDVSKVLDYAEDFKSSRSNRNINEERAHDIADVLHDALRTSGDAVIASTTHGEVVTSFHAVALCNRQLQIEGSLLQLQCTAYFENIVRQDSPRRGILFFVEPRPAQHTAP